jgi:hypothetical protein
MKSAVRNKNSYFYVHQAEAHVYDNTAIRERYGRITG